MKLQAILGLLPLAVHAGLSRPPHILVVVTDDQGFSDVGFTGGVIPTPAIDALASESVSLANFYVHPVCTPTRAALLTGRLAASTGLTGPLLLAAPCSLPSEIPTLAEELQHGARDEQRARKAADQLEGRLQSG